VQRLQLRSRSRPRMHDALLVGYYQDSSHDCLRETGSSTESTYRTIHERQGVSRIACEEFAREIVTLQGQRTEGVEDGLFF